MIKVKNDLPSNFCTRKNIVVNMMVKEPITKKMPILQWTHFFKGQNDYTHTSKFKIPI